jgi:hypothetical protein
LEEAGFDGHLVKSVDFDALQALDRAVVPAKRNRFFLPLTSTLIIGRIHSRRIP